MSNNFASYSLTENDLSIMTQEKKISWFCGRYRTWVVKQVKDAYEKTGAFLSLLISVCTTIDSLGAYFAGKPEAQRRTFIKFMYKYLDPRWKRRVTNERYDPSAKGRESWYLKKKRVTYAERFYMNFRCSLIHFMYIRGDGIEGNQKDYFDYNNRRQYRLAIKPRKLLKDFKNGVEKYLKKLESSSNRSSIQKKFFKTFSSCFL